MYKRNKTIELSRKLSNSLPIQALIILCKVFARPHLDYGDVLYNQNFNNSFDVKMESTKYNACLVLKGAFEVCQRRKSINN